MDEKLLNKIISVAYKDANLLDKIKIFWLAKKNKEVNELLSEYKKNADQARTLNIEECPERIINSLPKNLNNKGYEKRSFVTDIYYFVFARPAISSAILAVLILALVSTFVFDRPEIQQQYSQQEIETADHQVRQSLALVASIFRKTRQTVEKDVLAYRVGKPIRESFILVNEYFIGENKNENSN